jgi:hypothetical protein
VYLVARLVNHCERGSIYLPPARVGQGTLIGFKDGGTIEPVQRHGVSRMENGQKRRKAEGMEEGKDEGSGKEKCGLPPLKSGH